MRLAEDVLQALLFQGHWMFCQDRNAVPTFLPVNQGLVAECLEMVVREYVVWCFQFLQTNHVGLSILQPMVDVVDAGA